MLFLFNYLLSFIELLKLFYKINNYIFLSVKESFIVPNKKKIKNEVVVITGGAKGLGKEIALRFFKLGAKIIIIDKDNISGNELVNYIIDKGGSSYFYKCDVSKYENVEKIFKFINSKHHVSILINNVGVCNYNTLIEINNEKIKNTIKTNLLGHFWTVKCVLPKMLEVKKGHIVAIASNFGVIGKGSFTDYTSTKFGVIGFMESLEDEVRKISKNNIKFTTVCPAINDTKLMKTINSRFPKLFPLIKPKIAAKKIVESILIDEQFFFIPKSYSILYKILMRLPRKIRYLLVDYLNKTPDIIQEIQVKI